MPANEYSDDLDLALRLANRADSITGKRFRAADLTVESKPDMTPVTDADLAVERIIRDIIAIERHEDTVVGEELGGEVSPRGRHWVVDPIDGTKNFVRGVPVWATLIALFDDGVPVLGVVSAPALSRRWWAAQGSGAFCNFEGGLARRIGVSAVAELDAASLSISSLSGWRERGSRDQLIALTDEVWRVRGYGDFYSYCLVAEGAVDIAAEPEVSLWDLAALDVLVREAGGRFTALDGSPGPDGGSAVATNGTLHDAVLSRLG